MTQSMLTGVFKSKAVLLMPVENKTKPLITTARQFIRNHGSFNYTFFLTLCAIIGHFAVLGVTLRPFKCVAFR